MDTNLSTLESAVERARDKVRESAWEWAVALAAIHDSKLYPGSREAKGWEHYVWERWNIKRTQAFAVLAWVNHEISLIPSLEEQSAIADCPKKPPVTPVHKSEIASRMARAKNGEKPVSTRKNEALVEELYNQELSLKEINARVNPLGTTRWMVDNIVREIKVRQEAEVQIKVEDLELPQQKKLEIAVRQHKQKLDNEFIVRVQEALNRSLESRAKEWAKERELHKKILKGRRGCMTRKTFNNIRACLHPDKFADEKQKAVYHQAFVIFSGLEKLLLDEKESPTKLMHIPRSRQEWEGSDPL